MTRLLRALLLLCWPTLAAAQGWEAVAADGATCAKGGPWHFWVQRGVPDKLLFYLQGGGGCWLKANCDLQAQPTFDPVVEERDNPAAADGILKLQHPDNPFRGWTAVYVPYCTADVHLGGKHVDYDGVPMNHRGAANAGQALNWVRTNLPNPSEIVVTGGSAGAIPVPVYSSRLLAAYPKARVTGIGDGAGGYRSPKIPGILALWGVPQAIGDLPEFAGIEPERLTFENLYVAAGRAHPSLRLAQINQDHDEVQLTFLKILGIEGQPLAPLLAANLSEIRTAVPSFRSYLIASPEHTILTRPGLYTTVADGQRLTDWIREAIAARPK